MRRLATILYGVLYGVCAAAAVGGPALALFSRFGLSADAGAFFGALLSLSGAIGALTLRPLKRAREAVKTLTVERDMLRAQRDAERRRARGLERRTENLSIVREIHRSTNIITRAERLRQILEVLANLGRSVEATLFAEAGDGAGLRLVAHLKKDPSAEVFLRRDRPGPGRGLTVASAGCVSVAGGAELSGDLVEGGEVVGKIEAVLLGRRGAGGPRRGRRPEVPLKEALSSCDLDSRGAERALEESRVLKAHDPAAGRFEVSFPLTAEGRPVGALRLRLQDEHLLEGELQELEEAVSECARHVALALKKEADAERASHDALTGLFSRAKFDLYLPEALEGSREAKKPFALLVIDIDHFKRVNDTCGHRSGDLVLRGVASVIRRNIRACDAAFRYGGEEIAVGLPGSTPRAAREAAERLRRAVEAAAFSAEDGRQIPVTISVGVATLAVRAKRLQAASPGELFGRADRALYRSKNSGRNMVSVWTSRSLACRRAGTGERRAARTASLTAVAGRTSARRARRSGAARKQTSRVRRSA